MRVPQYEISSQADYIYVAKTTAIGAIGTAMQFMDYSGLMEMLGITTENITSSDSKDSTYGTCALTDEERAYYQPRLIRSMKPLLKMLLKEEQ